MVAGSLSKVVCRTASNSSKAITLEAASLAKFSDGSCTCSLGDTSVLVTTVGVTPQKPIPSSFAPLTVVYRQKAAAAGRIPMTRLRRDIGTTEKETLTSRIIDRSIRPSFTKGFYFDTQITCNPLAIDGVNDPDVLAINGASTSLAISDIPWNGPIGAVRMGLVGDKLVANPSRKEQTSSRLNLVMAANSVGNIMMLDGACNEPILMPDIKKAIKQGVRECQLVIESILKLQKSIGKPKRPLDLTLLPSEEQKNLAITLALSKVKDILSTHNHDKISRDMAMTEVRLEVLDIMKEKFPEADPSMLGETFNSVIKIAYKQVLNETGIRCDGRHFNELRPISCKVDLHAPLHGSALFQRGQTQVMCSATYDSLDAAYRSDSLADILTGVKDKNFMLHYEFPKFATNEIGRVTSMPDRREVGHGALAEKGIRPLVPEAKDMTMRLDCTVLESNGSSSMASVCAGSLSLMDAGVKIKEHVAGVAMGLVSDLGNQQKTESESTKQAESSNHFLLTDILGFEDYIGDMDFKIAGTRKALTALQLDVKPMLGVPTTILYQALQEAHLARGEIINIMEKVIREPRKEKKDNHPVLKTIHIPPHKKAKFIGFGGSNLKKMIAQIGVRISACDDELEDGDTSGATTRDNFTVFAPNKEAMEEAEEYIKNLLEKDYKEPELEYGNIYVGTIQEIRQNGVMISLYPNMKPALLSLAQLDNRLVSHPSALNLEVGQQIQVKYFGRDPASGHMRLSRKCLLMSSQSKVHRAPL